MTYFAIGESTGGAGERRLGPFETPDEAAQAGRKETRESNGGFVFRGVVDEANNQVGFDIEPIVSTNSVVRNAIAVKNRVAMNESLEYKIVIDLPNRQEVVSPLFSSEWAATVRAKDIAAKTGEKVRVVHRPTGNVVWKNALAANRRVAKNAMTVEQQREFQKTKLPKVEATVSAFEKECESIYKQVMAALKKADGVASVVSALEKKAESLKKPYHDALIVSDFDEAKSNELYKRVEQAQKKITACRDMASRIGYDIVNSFRVY